MQLFSIRQKNGTSKEGESSSRIVGRFMSDAKEVNLGLHPYCMHV
jgi:hypothetical protein